MTTCLVVALFVTCTGLRPAAPAEAAATLAPRAVQPAWYGPTYGPTSHLIPWAPPPVPPPARPVLWSSVTTWVPRRDLPPVTWFTMPDGRVVFPSSLTQSWSQLQHVGVPVHHERRPRPTR